MKNIKEIVMGVCGHKFAWNDYVYPKARVVKAIGRYNLTDYEKITITEWGKSDGKCVIFRS